MRSVVVALVFVLAAGSAKAQDRLPDLSYCRKLLTESRLDAACLGKIERALKLTDVSKRDQRFRSNHLAWRAVAATAKDNAFAEELTAEGERLMKEAIAVDPRNLFPILMLAGSEIEKKRLANAEKLIQSARAIAPDEAYVKLIQNTLDLRRLNYAAALDGSTALVPKLPKMEDVYLNRAGAYIGLKNVEAARKDLAKALSLATVREHNFIRTVNSAKLLGLGKDTLPAIDDFLKRNSSAKVQSLKGNILFEAKDYKGAYEALTQSLLLEPNQPDVFVLRGRNAFMAGQTDNAILDTEQAEKLAPRNAEIFYWRGVMLRELRKPDEAIAQFGRAITLNPLEPSYWHERAWIYDTEKKDDRSAVEDYAKAAALAPKNRRYLNNYGAVLERLGKLEEAETMYLAAIAVDPSYAFATRNLIILYGKMHEKNPTPAIKAKGLETLEKLLKIEPDNKENIKTAGYFHKRTRDYDNAATSFRKYLESKPNDLSALTELGNSLSNLERHAEVVPVLEKAIALSPDHAGNLNNLGWSKFKLGDFAKGLELSERSLKLRPDDPATLNTRAHAKAALGDREGAIKDHREAIRLSKPGSSTVKDSTDALKALGEEP